MINLLPPRIKEEIRFAKLNRVVLKYVSVVVVVAVVLAGIFSGAFYFLRQQSALVAADVADKQKSIAELGKTFLPTAQDASARLNAIKYVQGTKTHFSTLIADLAKVTPQSVQINNITLTGNEKQPVQIQITAANYDSVLAFRDAVASSPRISGVDIASISRPDDKAASYKASIVLGFKPGQAR